jgi:hypothetical protein
MSKTMDKTPIRPMAVFRWKCRCQDPLMLLATYEENGTVHVKIKDRYWHIRGEVRALCLRCGTEHGPDLSTEE